MKRTLAVSALCFIAYFLPMACDAVEYDAKYNKKKVEEINRFVLQQIDAQRSAYIKLREEAAKANGENKDGQNNSAEGEKKPEKEKIVVPSKFIADVEAIKKAVAARYRQAKEEDAKGPNPKVDTRSEVDLYDAARKQVEAEFNQSEEQLRALEKQDAEKEFPLYKQGEIVNITFARGNEPRRTYYGAFRREGKYKLFIGGKQLSYVDLPEYYRARFDAKENEKARREMINRHVRVGRYKLEKQEALFNKKKQMLEEQYAKNLPRGWVYVDDAWHIPADLVENFVKTREINHKNAVELQKKYNEEAAKTSIFNGPNN